MRYNKEPWKADQEWDRIRRGWFLGDVEFRQEMNKFLDEILEAGKRESYSGEAVYRHGEEKAERLVVLGLKALGMTENDLCAQKKSTQEKYGLAWLVRKHTCVRTAWIKERLRMGTATNFSAGIQRIERAGRRQWGSDVRMLIENIKI